MKTLAGRTAFVTGAASGIGLGIARALLERGMHVVIADLLQTHIDEARELLRGENRVHFIRMDVSDRTAMAAKADETERVFGKVHLLCNNAGVTQRTPIDEAGYADWDYILGVNLGGAINGLVEFLPLIKGHGQGGHVVNVSSMAGMIPVIGYAGLYSTSKFALRGLSESLRLALGPHRIGVSILCPGLVETRGVNAADLYRKGHLEGGADPVEKRPTVGAGLQPIAVGRLVADCVERNQFYIFPHGEHVDELKDYLERMLAAFPTEYEFDDGRREIERTARG